MAVTTTPTAVVSSTDAPSFESLTSKTSNWFQKNDFDARWSERIEWDGEAPTGLADSLSWFPKTQLAKKDHRSRVEAEYRNRGQTVERVSYFVFPRIAACIGRGACTVEEAVQENEFSPRQERAASAFLHPLRDLYGSFLFEPQGALLITPSGRESRNGRSCTLFEATVNRTYLEEAYRALGSAKPAPVDTMESKLAAMGPIYFIQKPIRICLDETSGFVVFREVPLDFSGVGTPSKTARFIWNLDSYSEQPSESLFVIPSG